MEAMDCTASIFKTITEALSWKKIMQWPSAHLLLARLGTKTEILFDLVKRRPRKRGFSGLVPCPWYPLVPTCDYLRHTQTELVISPSVQKEASRSEKLFELTRPLYEWSVLWWWFLKSSWLLSCVGLKLLIQEMTSLEPSRSCVIPFFVCNPSAYEISNSDRYCLKLCCHVVWLLKILGRCIVTEN